MHDFHTCKWIQTYIYVNEFFQIPRLRLVQCNLRPSMWQNLKRVQLHYSCMSEGVSYFFLPCNTWVTSPLMLPAEADHASTTLAGYCSMHEKPTFHNSLNMQQLHQRHPISCWICNFGFRLNKCHPLAMQ